jgi:hypothetical protein
MVVGGAWVEGGNLNIPLLKSDIPALDMYQTRIKSILDPVLSKEIIQGQLLSGLTVVSGINVINHKLGRNPIGWFIVDATASVTAYRSGNINSTNITLTFSAGASSVSLWVF